MVKREDRRILADACVFLAAKVEDTPKYPAKSLDQVIKAMHRNDKQLRWMSMNEASGLVRQEDISARETDCDHVVSDSAPNLSRSTQLRGEGEGGRW